MYVYPVNELFRKKEIKGKFMTRYLSLDVIAVWCTRINKSLCQHASVSPVCYKSEEVSSLGHIPEKMLFIAAQIFTIWLL